MAGAKQRILDVTAEHFRRQGYHGTGVKQILTAANAPFGSLYHHFPGGKEELGQTVIRDAGRMYLELFMTIAAQAAGPAEAAEDFFTGAAETLRETGYADACPIETVALEVASTNEPLREACADVFDSWVQGVAAYYEQAGIDAAEARDLAFTIIALIEGAFVLCRATRSTEALEVAGRRAAAAVRAALPRR